MACYCTSDYLVLVNEIIPEKANSVYSCQNYLPLILFNWTRLTSIVDFSKKSFVFRTMAINFSLSFNLSFLFILYDIR